MSKFFRHAILKKCLRFRPFQIPPSNIAFNGLNNRYENSLVNNSLLKCLHTSRPTLGFAKFKQLKEYSKNYWYVLGPIYLINNVVWFLICQFATQQGFDVIKLLRKLNVKDEIIEFLTSHAMGKHAVTIVLYKLLTPIRFLTLCQSSKVIIEYIVKNNLLPPKPINIWKKNKE
ncbi:hypothetical protein RN001_007173 [Aquatica leii]|uniref:DUF1279 domain-containing protein n=1 Tax=Aquatica leii TaxID=1421715 RepID=A0AAN7P806_9COLE|nr:hypothetical protein RN001_007173 [Aquatica leii]